MDERYIKIKGKSVIELYEPNKIPNITETISKWRNKSLEKGIGKIYIIVTKNRYKYNNLNNMILFDSTYQFPQRDFLITGIKNSFKVKIFTI